jgi:uncharacterized damage-inducible protein DinB
MHPFFEALYERFYTLHEEIRQALNAIPEEELDWTPNESMNSLAVLLVHVTGAERFLIGDVVMGEPSNRVRDTEFKVKGMSKADLFQRLVNTEDYMKAAFEKMSLEDLEAKRTHPRHGDQVSVSWALLYALEHVGIHVGHIQMTVQLWQLPDGND